MSNLAKSITDQYIVVGVNHHRATVEVREKFSLTGERRLQLLREAEMMGIRGMIAVTTCNRTEILARNVQPETLVDLLGRHTGGSRELFDENGFVIQGIGAIRHFFRVATGLEAQILGDLQIIRQVKEAYEVSSGMGMVDRITHRLIQSVFRTHKRSRNETSLGTGAATTAYAAVQMARRKMKSLKDKKILLVGAGKIGKITCKNLISLGAGQVVVINRNPGRAEKLSDRFHVSVEPFQNLTERVLWADLVIVATGASEPVVNTHHFQNWYNSRGGNMISGTHAATVAKAGIAGTSAISAKTAKAVTSNLSTPPATSAKSGISATSKTSAASTASAGSQGGKSGYKVLVDLSVPRNIDPEVGTIEGIELINMDMLNDKTDSTFRQRQANIPGVESIIDEELDVFFRWVSEQRVVPTIRALNDKLDAICISELDRIRNKIPGESMPQVEQLTRRIMKKVMAHSIEHLRESPHQTDEAADLLNTLFKLEPEKSVD